MSGLYKSCQVWAVTTPCAGVVAAAGRSRWPPASFWVANPPLASAAAGLCRGLPIARQQEVKGASHMKRGRRVRYEAEEQRLIEQEKGAS